MNRFFSIVSFIVYASCFVYLGSWVSQLLISVLDVWPRRLSPAPLRASRILNITTTLSSVGDVSQPEEEWSRVLVLSSIGRSGSSFLGQLLSQQQNTLYLFEPLLYIQGNTYDVVDASISRKLLTDLYNCHFKSSWVRWAAGRVNSLDKRVKLSRERHETLTDHVTEVCFNSSHRIIKVIRMRLSWVQGMLQDKDSPLKLIHLVRDPRASFSSLKKLDMLQKNYTLWCPRILEDLQLVSKMEALFPRTFISIKYEDLCNDPYGTALRLWRILTGSNTDLLPESWKKYLEMHTSTDSSYSSFEASDYGTVRNTSKECEAWRREIDGETLMAVEKHCGQVLSLLKYNKFGTISNVRNLSLPLR